MILGVGTDLCSIDRIAETLEKHGERFMARCFAENERGDAKFMAKRWAAKEACAKALGTGIRDDIILRDIEVVKDALGAPSLKLHGGAKNQLDKLSANARIHLSLSDDNGFALAFVVISAG